jgi:hypothetical protein
MKRKHSASIVTAVCFALCSLTGCGGSGSSKTTTPPVVALAVTSGSGQSAQVNRAFSVPLIAVLTTDGSPTSGATVTFTAPVSGASGNFPAAASTDTETTDSNGQATSKTLTANSIPGSYTVTASVAGARANFSLTNNNNAVVTTNYVFSVTGLELINKGPNSYGIVGVVSIDSNGNVLGGEQDYNDAFGITSPQPAGDSITGGALAVDATTGQGSLTLITNNTSVGLSGTESFGVQFVNAKHALINQFDTSATSSGSLDVQTPATISGGYAFTLSGVDTSYFGQGFGGVFTVSGTDITSGTFDVNDNGNVIPSTSLTGTISAPDAMGRGTINSPPLGIPLNYYVVGPETLRLLGVDPADLAVGSAFGQGSASFSSTSLGASVFGFQSNIWSAVPNAAAGMLTTNTSSGTFQGVADDDEFGTLITASVISGTYTIFPTGYGTMQITNAGLGNVAAMNFYMVDPALNLSDPNSPTGGGGALVLDMDAAFSSGAGLLIPQTDTSTSSFTGSYGFGALDYHGSGITGPEFDFVGSGAVSGGALTGTGMAGDPFGVLSATAATYTAAPVSLAISPDGTNPGRYDMTVTLTTGTSPNTFIVPAYQASGAQLIWTDQDAFSFWLGTLQQQGSLAGLPAARKAGGKIHSPTTALNPFF